MSLTSSGGLQNSASLRTTSLFENFPLITAICKLRLLLERALVFPQAWSLGSGLIGVAFIFWTFSRGGLLIMSIVAYHAIAALLFRNRLVLWAFHVCAFFIVSTNAFHDVFQVKCD